MSTELATPQERDITYHPLGGTNEVRLTVGMVRKYLCTPTKSGAEPSDADVLKYMMLCRARQLDPWVGDAYLVGYDSQDGAQFSLITAHQALLKRGEQSPQYDGMESGVIVQKRGDEPVERPGKVVYENEVLVGGWARVHRKDRSHPSCSSLLFKTYNTNRSRWRVDPAGMIVKCAEAEALRKAFPSQCGGLYTQDEMDHAHEQRRRLPVESIASMTSKIVPAARIEQPQPIIDQPASEQVELDWESVDADFSAQPDEAGVRQVFDAYCGTAPESEREQLQAVMGHHLERVRPARRK